MKDNARSFFLITIVSTVAFVAVGTLYGVQAIFLGVLNYMPYDFSAPSEQNSVEQVEKTLTNLHIAAEKSDYIYYIDEKQTTIHASEYNKIAQLFGEKSLSPKENTAIQLQATGTNHQITSVKQVTIGHQKLAITAEQSTGILPIYQGTFVVPDAIPLKGTATNNTVWVTRHASEKQKIEAGETLADNPMITSVAYTKDTTLKSYAPMLFIGIFISLVFLVSAGSFLYFRLYSDLANDTQKYRMIFRLGLSRKELKKMIYRQVGILFFIPLLVALAHSVVALIAMYHIFSLSMQGAAIQVLILFVCVYTLYYFVASRLYFQSIATSIGMAQK
jgi:putative ABC transport system permease protein